MNAAQCREKARDAENALDWLTASEYYSRAADLIPAASGLNERDVRHLRERAAQCLHAYRVRIGEAA